MRRIILLLLLLGLLFVGDQPGKAVNAATKLSETPPEVLAILEQLSPESRVGQLFLVTFNGTVAEPETPIYNLLANYQVGGVVMSSSHNNFNNIESVTQQTSQLIRTLQTVANDAAQSPPNVGVLTPAADGERPYIPLFVGLAHTGDSPGLTQQLLGEMTPLPSAMALGATWDVEQARALGHVWLESEARALLR